MSSRWRRLLLGPGWLRVAWMTPLFFGIGFGIVVGIRALAGWDPVLHWEAIITVAALTTAPLGFLAGLGAFDYWLAWAFGQPTRPEDHSGHGARRWTDYFRINTDHKVIGVQYVSTTVFFFLAGGLGPENVAEAIAAVRPFAVDVTSGVESAAGRKDYGRLRAFIEAARGL